MYEKYEWLSIYILMIKKWDSMNKSKDKYEKIWWSKGDIQWIKKETSTDNCKWIMRYFAKIIYFSILIELDQKINL